MAKQRLIPKLQMKVAKNNTERLLLVVTREFEESFEIGDPVSQAKIFQDQAADELIFINIDQQNQSVDTLAKVIYNVSKEIFMPICVGGGVRTLADFRLLLSNGADKISINSEALRQPGLISKAADRYGSQCVVVSIDYKKNNAGIWKVYSEGGKLETDWDPIDWAIEVEKRGAGELLLSSISHDGRKNGMELEISAGISSRVNIPVVLSAGCGEAVHFIEGFKKAKVDAVAAGSFFAHRDQNFMQTRAQIKNSGVNIRSKK